MWTEAHDELVDRWRLDKDVAVKLRQQSRNTTTNPPPPDSRAAVPVPCPKDSALLLLQLQIRAVGPEHRGHPFGHLVLSQPYPVIDPSQTTEQVPPCSLAYPVQLSSKLIPILF